jgi:hypothetical protein
MAAAGARITERPVTITGPTGKESASTLRVQEWPPEVRTKRAWKRLALWWGIGLFAALIPPHFPWITLAFIGGPIAAWLASRQGALVLQQEVTCPDCGTTATLEEQAESWPIGVRCSPCRGVFWIAPKSA